MEHHGKVTFAVSRMDDFLSSVLSREDSSSLADIEVPSVFLPVKTFTLAIISKLSPLVNHHNITYAPLYESRA